MSNQISNERLFSLLETENKYYKMCQALSLVKECGGVMEGLLKDGYPLPPDWFVQGGTIFHDL